MTSPSLATPRGALELSNPLRAFLIDQVDRLERFDYVSVGSPTMPFLALEVGRTESDELEVRVPPRLPATPIPPPKRAQLVEAGFQSDDAGNPLRPWIQAVATPVDAVDVAIGTLQDIFDVRLESKLDLLHGSRREEHEAALRLEELRGQVEGLLTEILGHVPERDSDDDFICPSDQLRIIVGPRVVAGGLAIVRVIAITNTGVTVTPDLGLSLARLNFGIVIGRFALDVDNRSIWFDETLLGDEISHERLHVVVDVVARTASQWATRLQQMFGGRTQFDAGGGADYQDSPKPGAGAYL